MDAFVEFVTSVDGSATWPKVMASFERAFHPDSTVVTSSGALDRRGWSEIMCRLVECGASIHDFELNTSDSDHASFRMTMTVQGGSLNLGGLARFRDGRVVRLEPTDAAAYGELLERTTITHSHQSPQRGATNMSDQNKETVRRWVVDGFSGGADAFADEIVDASFAYHHPGFPPVGNGPDGYRQLVQIYRGAFPNLTISLDDMLAEDGKVVACWTAKGTNTGEMMGMPPTGNAFEATGMNLFRLEDGKVAEVWTNFDDLGMMQQLGMIPTPG